MESLKLQKFKNDQLDNKQLMFFLGGQGSSKTEECQTEHNCVSDTQTDIYSDTCDGDWNFECSYTTGYSTCGPTKDAVFFSDTDC